MKKYFLILLFMTELINSQTWQRFVNWNESSCIVQGNDSIIWVGSKVGLIKWNVNNMSYKTYDNGNGLPSTAINDMIVDSEGSLWMATDNGIVKYDGYSFDLYNYKNTSILPKARFYRIVADSNNNIYAGTTSYIHDDKYNYGSIISYYDGNWKVFHGADNNFDWHVTDMVVYNGRLIIALPFQNPAWTTRFFTFEHNELTMIPDLEIPIFGMNFTIDYQDSLWLASGRFLFKYRDNSWSEIVNGDREKVGSIWNMAWADNKDGLWMAGTREGLYYFDIEDNIKGKKYTSNLPAGMKKIKSYNYIIRSHININDDDYFVSQNGLIRYKNNKFSYYQIPKTVGQNNISGLGVSPQNEILISGSSSTQKFDGDNWVSIGDRHTGQRSGNKDFRYAPNGQLYTNYNQLYPQKDSYSGYVSGLDFDGLGNLWITTPVTKYQWPSLLPVKYSIEDMGLFIRENQRYPQFRDVAVDKYNHVWFVGWNADITMYDGTRWHSFNSEDVGVYWLNLDYAYTDSRGRKWFADNTTSPNWGLIMYDNKKWSVLNFPDLYRGQYIYQIDEDHFGNLWFASESGLLKYDNKNWYIYNSSNSNVDFTSVYAVTVDQRGNVWVGTKKGVYVYNQYGIDLNSDIKISPVTSFDLFKRTDKVTVHFSIAEKLPNLKKVELQRGYTLHKFWTTSSMDYTLSDIDSLVDSSLAIGSFLYRIKAVDSYGRAYYSNPKRIFGDTVSVKFIEFISKKEEQSLYLYWKTSNERDIEYFEIQSGDMELNKKTLIAKVKADNSTEVDQYSLLVEALVQNAPEKEYLLFAVFSDSTISDTLRLKASSSLPEKFIVSKNYPNPFNSTTKIDLSLPNNSKVKIEVFNILGQKVKTVLNKEYAAGIYSIPIEIDKLSSGMYIYVVTAGEQYKSGKMVYIR